MLLELHLFTVLSVYGRIARNSQWLSTVIYTVIYVDNSRLHALQKTPDPPWLALTVPGAYKRQAAVEASGDENAAPQHRKCARRA